MTEASTYRTELTGRVRQVTDDVAWAVRSLTPEQYHYRPAENDWSIHEHLGHMRDMEQEVYLPLLRWATVADMLDPLDYSRREWHELRYRPAEQLPAVLEDLLRMRDEELLIFRDMSDSTWMRWRNDTRWGPLTCQWLAELMYRHALDHLQGLMALRQDINLAMLQPPAYLSGGAYSARRA